MKRPSGATGMLEREGPRFLSSEPTKRRFWSSRSGLPQSWQGRRAIVDAVEVRPITIPSKIYGHPGIAFGGYVAGVLAAEAPGGVKVDFRRPVPPGVELLFRSATDRATLGTPDEVFASAEPFEVAIDIPSPPSWNEALEGVAAFETEADQQFCFGCGPGRAEGDGLRLFTGLSARGDLVTATWRPSKSFGDPNCVHVATEFVWAALDCPGGWARKTLLGPETGRALTAYLAAVLLRPVKVSQCHVVFGWLIERSGRKTTVGSAIATEGGEVCAVAQALWLDARNAE